MTTPKTRSDLASLVPDLGVFLELGVAAGDFAAEVCRANPRMHYIGIDKWDDHHDEDEMQVALRKIAFHAAGAFLYRRRFDEMLDEFTDESIDLIYIDGYAHTGQDGGQTLADWWPKVKPGGIFAGHDYHPEWQPTIDAVDHFVSILQSEGNLIELEIIDWDYYPSWMIRKPNERGQHP